MGKGGLVLRDYIISPKYQLLPKQWQRATVRLSAHALSAMAVSVVAFPSPGPLRTALISVLLGASTTDTPTRPTKDSLLRT